MGAGKSPNRVIDGPYANWDTSDENCQIVLANNGTIKLGQPVCLDVTQLGPDNNVPNNAAALPLCERVVATNSANAGPIFGVVTQVLQLPATGVKMTYVNGVPTWTNSSGANVTLTLQVRQLGWGYVYAGTAAIGQSGGNSILVGSTLIISSAQPFAIQGTGSPTSTVGVALATAVNTTQTLIPSTGIIGNIAGAQAATTGVISIVPQSLAGIVPSAVLLLDTLQSGAQESVTVASISIPTFSISIANTHTGGFKITGPVTNPAKNSVLISTPGAGVTYSTLVACFINVYA